MPHQTHIPTSITFYTPSYSYGIAVIFITACVASGGAVDNESVGAVLLWRFVYTISACVAYLLSLLIWIPTQKDMIALSLSKQARAVHAYCREVMAPRDNDNDQSQPNTWEGKEYHFDSSETTFSLRAQATRASLHTLDNILDACMSSIWKGEYSIDPFVLGPSLCLELYILFSVPGMLDMVGVKYNERFRYISKKDCAKLQKLADRLEGKLDDENDKGSDEDEAGGEEAGNEDEETDQEKGCDDDNNTFFDLVIARANKRMDDAGL